jgi:hypothetical protein
MHPVAVGEVLPVLGQNASSHDDRYVLPVYIYILIYLENKVGAPAVRGCSAKLVDL